MKPRLYLDEDILPALAALLREQGYGVLSVHDVGALGLSDDAQLQRATGDGRAIVSCNHHDFTRIGREWADADRAHAGIIISYRQFDRRTLGDGSRILAAFLETLTAEDLINTVRVLEDVRS